MSARDAFKTITAAFANLGERFGLNVLGTMDDSQMMVGSSSTWPWTCYILADAPDLAAVAAVCNLLRLEHSRLGRDPVEVPQDRGASRPRAVLRQRVAGYVAAVRGLRAAASKCRCEDAASELSAISNTSAARRRGPDSGASSSDSSGSSWANPRNTCVIRVRTRNASRSGERGVLAQITLELRAERHVAILQAAQVPGPFDERRPARALARAGHEHRGELRHPELAEQLGHLRGVVVRRDPQLSWDRAEPEKPKAAPEPRALEPAVLGDLVPQHGPGPPRQEAAARG